MSDSLDSYLADLPLARKEVFAELRGAVARSVATLPDSLANFVFLPGQIDHLTFGDAADVFWLATQQLMLGEGGSADSTSALAPLPDVAPIVDAALAATVVGSAGTSSAPTDAAPDLELPLLYVGYHLINRLTRRRESLGFLVTDRHLIVQDEVSGIRRRPGPVSHALYADERTPTVVAAELVATSTERYDWSHARRLVTPIVEPDLLAALTTGVAAVLANLAVTGAAPPPRVVPRSAADLEGRVRELGLGPVVKFPTDPKQHKHFAKLTKALALPANASVRFTVTDATLAGPYGLVVTADTIHSKDLMEDPVSTPIAQVDVAGLAFSADSPSLVLAPGQLHAVPAFLDAAQKTALLTLLKEFASGAVG
jgi:hypothetical protein